MDKITRAALEGRDANLRALLEEMKANPGPGDKELRAHIAREREEIARRLQQQE